MHYASGGAVFPTMPMIHDLEDSVTVLDKRVKSLEEQHEKLIMLVVSRETQMQRELQRVRALLTATCILVLLTLAVAMVALGYAL